LRRAPVSAAPRRAALAARAGASEARAEMSRISRAFQGRGVAAARNAGTSYLLAAYRNRYFISISLARVAERLDFPLERAR
jgi:hypothetical protein